MQVEVKGFSHNQHVLATVIWNMDSQQAVDGFISSLASEDLRRDAWIAREMLTAAVIDQHMDVSDSVVEYLDKLGK